MVIEYVSSMYVFVVVAAYYSECLNGVYLMLSFQIMINIPNLVVICFFYRGNFYSSVTCF